MCVKTFDLIKTEAINIHLNKLKLCKQKNLIIYYPYLVKYCSCGMFNNFFCFALSTKFLYNYKS